MSESEVASSKPEAVKSDLWLQYADGSIQQVEEMVATYCLKIGKGVDNGKGSSENHAISLPKEVKPYFLGLLLDYCRFHQVPGRTSEERQSFDDKFVKSVGKRIGKLLDAAESLECWPLLRITEKCLKATEQQHENSIDPPMRRLNRLNAKLKERQRLKDVVVKEEKDDDRSIDDLVAFINGDDSKNVKPSKKKKKKTRRKKKQLKDPSENETNSALKDASDPSQVSHEAGGSMTHESAEDDADTDDGLDPAMREQLDREVAEFERRLNSHWEERRKWSPSLGQGQKHTGNDRNE